MNSVELALKKQRLLMNSQALRAEFGRNGLGVAPAFHVADGVREGARWLGRHPEVVAGVAIVVVVARPATVWRWGRRGYAGWQLWQKLRGHLMIGNPVRQ